MEQTKMFYMTIPGTEIHAAFELTETQLKEMSELQKGDNPMTPWEALQAVSQKLPEKK